MKNRTITLLPALCVTTIGLMTLAAGAQTTLPASGDVGVAQGSSPGAASPVQSAHARDAILVLPWIVPNGTSGARKRAADGLEELLSRSAFAVSHAPVEDTGPMEADGPLCWEIPVAQRDLPTLLDMVRPGRIQGSRYVFAGRAKWHTRTIWGFISTKTRSTCSVDIQIAGVEIGRFTLDLHDVTMESTAGKSVLATAAATVPYIGLAELVGAGPKTPQEERAVMLATGCAVKVRIETCEINRDA